MSQMLPQTVRIKRKRQDEPVETLHVHTHDDTKKRRFTVDQPDSAYPTIFKRVADPGASARDPSASATAASAGSPATGPAPSSTVAASQSSSSSSRPSSCRSTDRKILAPAPVTRRFHLSTRSYSGSDSSLASIQKRKSVATLVETKPKKTRTSGLTAEVADYVAQRSAERSSNDVQMQVDGPLGDRPLKRPGRTARSVSPAVGVAHAAGKNNTATTSNNGTVERDGKVSDTKAKDAGMPDSGAPPVDPGLLSEMQKFAQEVESAEREKPAAAIKPVFHQSPQVPSVHTPQKLKFQPRPVARYRDRHPESTPTKAQATVGQEMDIDNNDSDSDGEYVYDTYVRYDGPPDTVLVDPLNATSLPSDIGLLVINLDEQPLWEAYLEDAAGVESDKEFVTDDEDENAEDFYANEYPEDEVASDDERGEGAYGYRVGASDEEEYGLWSDEEEEAMKRPWGKLGGGGLAKVGRRPDWLRSGGNGSGSDSD